MRWLLPLLFLVSCPAPTVGPIATAEPAAAAPSPTPAPPDVLDLGGGVSLDLVLLQPGSLQLGTRTVRFDTPRWVGTTEMTNEAFARFRPEHTLASQKPMYDGLVQFDGPRRPAIVSWLDAVAFTTWASEATGRTVRLPSESEWELFARAGTTTEFFWGDDPAAAAAYANGNDPVTQDALVAGDHGQPQDDVLPNRDPHRGPAPVGSYKANPWGLFDVHGNVMEWCADRWEEDLDSAPLDGSPRPGSMEARGRDDSHALRGGGFNSGPRMMAAGSRNYCFASAHFNSTGFRVVVEP